MSDLPRVVQSPVRKKVYESRRTKIHTSSLCETVLHSMPGRLACESNTDIEVCIGPGSNYLVRLLANISVNYLATLLRRLILTHNKKSVSKRALAYFRKG